MKYWFIVFEWWEIPRVRENLIENVLWQGNHPCDYLVQQREAGLARGRLPGNNMQDYRLLWWSEVPEQIYLDHEQYFK